jgi:hypothetical protein
MQSQFLGWNIVLENQPSNFHDTFIIWITTFPSSKIKWPSYSPLYKFLHSLGFNCSAPTGQGFGHSSKKMHFRGTYYDCIKRTESWVPIAHTYNPSYSGGTDQEEWGLRPDWANNSWHPISKKPIIKKAGGVVQGVGHEFKSQSDKKKSTDFSLGVLIP